MASVNSPNKKAGYRKCMAWCAIPIVTAQMCELMMEKMRRCAIPIAIGIKCSNECHVTQFFVRRIPCTGATLNILTSQQKISHYVVNLGIMKVLLDIKDSKADFVMELLQSLSFVKAEPITDAKTLLIEEIKEAVEEMKLIRAGKAKARNAEDFLNEL